MVSHMIWSIIIHPGFTKLINDDVIEAARLLIPEALSAIDTIMEETFMKFAKGIGDLRGIYDNYAANQRWA